MITHEKVNNGGLTCELLADYSDSDGANSLQFYLLLSIGALYLTCQ